MAIVAGVHRPGQKARGHVRLAAETCADAHALDEGRPLATLALSAARALSGLPYAGEGGADARRSAWAAVGVHLDDLSSLVLCLGLAGDDHSPTGRMLSAARAAGEPCVLTLRQLLRHEAPLRSNLVRICENPVVVAAGGATFAYHGDFGWGGIAIAFAVHERADPLGSGAVRGDGATGCAGRGGARTR
ncbi:hypothetical protein GCM10009850_022790 [Nonomuraea monospora]|uniref:Conserved hypothetical protein CHP02679 N terminus domain-containing protein n=1 Tax=Nonomuraea monospora TaxID=568818 RepID=A0ABN3CC81_9ACTN